MLQLALAFAVATQVSDPSRSSPAGAKLASECTLSPTDQAWLDQSMHAWNYAAAHISGIGHLRKIEALIFDKDCLATSTTAMNGGPSRWSGTLHHGTVSLPGGSVAVGVVSFAGSEKGKNFYVMSTPSVWRAAGIRGNSTTLAAMMTAVMLHEGSHVAQMPTYGARMDEITARNHLPQDFDDDSIQKQFASNADFAMSVGRETRLLAGAANAKSRQRAVDLVRSARDLMKARYARWFTGPNRYMAEAEPVFLTLEGSGQWLAYTWETDPRGGHVPSSAVLSGFLADHWWTQGEGFAAFMALQRLVGPAWKRQAFHDGRKDVLEMLDEAVAAP